MTVFDTVLFVIGVGVYASIFGVIIWAALAARKAAGAATDQKAASLGAKAKG